MQVKFFYVLSFLALGAVALTNCAKDTPAFSAENPTVATPRGGCDITIETSANLEICGTQTNATVCAVNTFGLENVAAGTYTYTITPPASIQLTNVLGSNPSDAIQIKISSSTQLGQVHYINDGDSKTFDINDQCEIQ